MIVDERDEAEIIAMEMRRAHFDIGVIEIATDRDPDTPRAAP
jgi:hypothetical protein